MREVALYVTAVCLVLGLIRFFFNGEWGLLEATLTFTVLVGCLGAVMGMGIATLVWGRSVAKWGIATGGGLFSFLFLVWWFHFGGGFWYFVRSFEGPTEATEGEGMRAMDELDAASENQ